MWRKPYNFTIYSIRHFVMNSKKNPSDIILPAKIAAFLPHLYFILSANVEGSNTGMTHRSGCNTVLLAHAHIKC